MKRIFTYMMAGVSLLATTSCSDFLNTAPYDALAPSNTWKTEGDAEKFLIGCYDGWIDESGILYWDCASDFGYSNFLWDHYQSIGNGTMTAGLKEVSDHYTFSKIRQCNDFLTNIANVPFADEAKKNDMIAQVKVMRAYDYFDKNWQYGGVPIIDSYSSREEAQVPRNTEAEVNKFIEDELDAAIPMFLEDKASKAGYIDRATALAIKMRHALYYGKYERAKEAARIIMDMGKFDLEEDYGRLFRLEGQDSKEIIAAVQHMETYYGNMFPAIMANNEDGGWSSMVPTWNLVNAYEMDNGLTKEEAGDYYDPKHPFANRDPRLAMSIAFPGMDWIRDDGTTKVLNTLNDSIVIDNKKVLNLNYSTASNNSSKTGLTWNKYVYPLNQFADMWDTGMNTILFRYAEVLLSYVEAENELNGPSEDVYGKLNQIRNRAGMPIVDRAKYGTQEKLRELIRRERSVEMAGEGLRRADILRWKDAEGKMLAETLMNGELRCPGGTIDYTETNPYKRAVIIPDSVQLVESRGFSTHNRYLPIPQKYRDLNDKLEQNPGY
ncbi:RagB/SusD family nutrient uptake outer membrane protein [Bacteroides muris (ex Afrizal et al. 2022)]|uniref:RagB/SusD family nutrient uptake outer membrane protein n=2 Tax=Bacteroides TaxID=816 RepID=A0A4S2AE27_9BACE|nr:RagB/SusD family nutrient uptake outer membrane protein [Bacteroides muris (ex Afrizal et al. 2022)]TGX99146.1 RagB/SusD family nutrient uptake outer membrane protein [Bacteroides muris (ex Afrizal et al. 2022)]